MKPIKLVMQAFGPYKGKEEIEFEHLSQNGIFLIKGPTGSGKTTIFDAMTIALYGGSSGEDSKSKTGRNDFTAWRCTQSEDDVPTIVEFTFSIEDCVFRFTRKMEKKRTSWSTSIDASQLGEDNVFHPFFENPKLADVNQKAESIIGLNKDQFRQVVLLPQGQFEKFLVASSSEKEIILSKIFGTDIWKKYADALVVKTMARYEGLKNAREQVIESLSEEEKVFTQVDDILIFVDSLKAHMEELDKAHKAYDGDKRQQELKEDIKLGQQFMELHKLEAELASLVSKKDEIESIKVELAEAEKAEAIRPFIDTLVSAEAEFQRRDKELATAKEKLSEYEEKKAEAERKYKDHTESNVLEKNQIRMGELKAKEETYANLDQVESDYKKAKASYEDAKKAYELAETKKNACAKIAREKSEVLSFEEDKAKAYRDRYYDGICGEIAAEQLVPGKKCPVCGSIEHPEPAERIPNSISKSDLDKQEKAVLKAKDEWNKAEENHTKSQEELTTRLEELNSSENAKIGLESQLKTLKENLEPGIRSLSELKEFLSKLEKERLSYEAVLAALNKQLQDAENDLTAQVTTIKNATTEAQNAKANMDQARTELDKQLEAHNYDSLEKVKALLKSDSVRDEMKKTITEYDTNVKEKTKTQKERADELKGKKEPDVALIDERQNEIRSEMANYTKERTSTEKEMMRLSDLHKKLKPKEKLYYEEIDEAESDYQFAKRLRGDTGIGLQRYVLGIMFDQVISEANIMLQKVHGGRYHLYRSNEGGSGNKKGLELKVHDNRSPEKEGRSVSLLSGGEKFLVSLSLSIGMSTVAQQKGVHIDALFIDEGFGTLDETSIEDAMDILDCVQKSNGLIGIISHVKILETTIMNSIEVIKTKDGSRIKVN